MTGTAVETSTLLAARGLELSRGGRRLLDGTELEIRRGEVVALESELGQGATSLLKICGGLLAPDAGEVRLDGVDLYRAPYPRRREAKRRIGFVFQEMALIQNQSLVENVALPLLYHGAAPAHEVEERVDAILEAFGLRDVAQRLPSELAQHEAHSAALARVLVGRPELLVLDDFFARLHAGHRQSSWTTIRESLGDGLTALVSTTDRSRLPMPADRIWRLRGGRIEVDDGPGTPGPGHPAEEAS